MSIPMKITVTCPKCGKAFQATAFRSVNTDLRKDLPEQIISGKLFDAACPRCGFVAHLEYNVLYNDLKHKSMIWLISPKSPSYEKDLQETRNALLSAKYMGGITRIVNDTNSLREKVACLENGRDDRIIELYKIVLSHTLEQQQPGCRVDKAFYTSTGSNEVFFFYDTEGKEYHTEFPEDGYRFLLNEYLAPLEEYPFEPSPIIDRNWAHQFLSWQETDDAEDAPTPKELQKGTSSMDNDSLPQIRFCRKCGSSLLPDSEYCSNCGTKVIRS